MKPKGATDGRGQPKDIQTFFNIRSRQEQGPIPMDVEDGQSEDSGRGHSEILEPPDEHWEYQEFRIYVSSV